MKLFNKEEPKRDEHQITCDKLELVQNEISKLEELSAFETFKYLYGTLEGKGPLFTTLIMMCCYKLFVEEKAKEEVTNEEK